jgi:hypothetical protein
LKTSYLYGKRLVRCLASHEERDGGREDVVDDPVHRESRGHINGEEGDDEGQVVKQVLREYLLVRQHLGELVRVRIRVRVSEGG